MRLMI